MAISANTTPEFPTGLIVLRGMQLSGYQHTRFSQTAKGFAADFAAFSDFLEMRISALSLEGLFAHAVQFLYQALTVDLESYTVAGQYQRIFGDAVYISADEANVLRPSSETLVQPATREEYHLLLQKDSTSSYPTHYYPDREAGVVYVWPIPTEAGTVRFQVQKRLADVQTADVTPELQREWAEYLTFCVAEHVCLAKSFELQRAAYFQKKAEMQLPKHKAAANQGAVSDALLVHPTGWS